jgi:hypothetical protein
MSRRDDFERMIREMAMTPAPVSDLTPDPYDAYLTDFLNRTQNPEQANLRWRLMRVGIRAAINEVRASVRDNLKSSPQRTPVSSHRKSEVANYAKLHKLTKAEADAAISRKRISAGIANVAAFIEDEAGRRASAILMNWFVDGDIPLGKVKGKDLVRLEQREHAAAHGHSRAAEFYRRLADLVPEDRTVENAIDANEFLRIFDTSFAGHAGGDRFVLSASPGTSAQNECRN